MPPFILKVSEGTSEFGGSNGNIKEEINVSHSIKQKKNFRKKFKRREINNDT